MRNDYAAKAWLNRERQIDRDTQLITEGIAWGIAGTLVIGSCIVGAFVDGAWWLIPAAVAFAVGVEVSR